MVIADVVDKGLPAALFMTLCRSTFRSTSISESAPDEALERANQLIRRDSGGSDDNPDGMGYFVSAVYAILEIASGEVIFANAGHNRPLCLRCDGRVEELQSTGIVLGLFDDISLEQSRISLRPGDSLIFYTDGFSEAINDQGELFNTERLVQLLEDSAGLNPQRILDRIVKAVFDWLGSEPQSDDLTLFILRRLPSTQRS
jgi:sigma-B regulation protein RsbU (phosphoserine phosphatase)